MAEQNTGSNEQRIDQEMPEVQQELSQVASSPKQNILILVVIGIVFSYLFFNFFLNKKEQTTDNKVVAPIDVSKPAVTVVSDVPPIPQLPEPPKLVDPGLPPPPPTTPESTQPSKLESDVKTTDVSLPTPPPPPISTPEETLPNQNLSVSSIDSTLPTKLLDSDEAKKRKDAKRKSAIVLIAGSPPKKTPEQLEQEADFKNRGDMGLVLGHGKIIDAVLESSISTDFGGEVRAVISRDVFSESGKVTLIPKGSRVFGIYTTGISGAYGRVSIEWIKIDLASGYTLNLKGTAVDNLGKRGVQGRVDNKFKERIANSVLMSAFNIGLANALDKITPPVASSQATTENTTAASQLNTIALAIFNDTTKDANTKSQLICSSVQAAIPDKTSAAYKTFSDACFNLSISPPGTNAEQNLTSLMSSVNAASTALLTSAATATTPSQAQIASKQAFTDVTNTVKDMITQQQFTPTITIDQGTAIKIYVTKDYKFPKGALNKSRLIQ